MRARCVGWVFRGTVVAAAITIAAGCSREQPVIVRVIAPDGGDPFTVADGATHARVVLEDDASAARTVSVGPDGVFSLEIRPSRSEVIARLRIEALRDGTVIATGATPPMQWQALAGHTVTVLMQWRDSLVPAPGGAFRSGRSDVRLVSLGTWGVAAVTLPPGETMPRRPDGYDLVTHTVEELRQPVPPEFDGDTALIPVRNGTRWLLQRGARAVLYSNDASRPVDDVSSMVPGERAALVAATGVEDTVRGGGWLLGGRDAAGVLSRRVDRVNDDGTFVSVLGSLAVARARPDVVELRAGNETTLPLWLVMGGQRSGDPWMEVYSPTDVGGTVLRTPEIASLERRTDAAAVCLVRDAQGCSRVLVLGGREDGMVAAEDVVIDGVCARVGGAGCTLVTARGSWLVRRRWGAKAALAEGARVLVAGGYDSVGPVREVETVDVSNPSVPQPGRVVHTLTYDDPALMALSNGSVLLAGGRDASGARGDLWFYRY